MCEVKHCKQKDVAVSYYNKTICRKHWYLHCDDTNFFDLKKELKL